MKDFLIVLASAVVGAIGFAMLFNIRAKVLPWATLGAMLGTAVYLLCSKYTPSILLSSIAGAFASTIYSDIMARKLKVPVTLLLLPAIVPLVPGGGLYYTMASVLSGDKNGMFSYGLSTADAALGIAVGILVASLFRQEFSQFRNICNNHKNNMRNR